MDRLKDALNPPTTKEKVRRENAKLRTNQRQMQRGVRDMKRDEQQIKNEIKKAAKSGNMEATRILAKSLVNNRHGQNRQNQASAHLMGVQNQLRMVQANETLATSMASSSKVMASMNKQMDPYKMQKNMQQYAMENEKMSISQEMMDDAMDSVMGVDEGETDDVVNAVLTEVLGDQLGQLGMTPNSALKTNATPGADAMTSQIEAELRALGVPNH